MANLNSATVSGNLTRDPETRWLAEDGKSAIVSFGIATNRRRFDKTTEDYIEEVSFFDIEVFGGFAVLCAKKLKKADSASVQGRLLQQTWETTDGKRSKVVIVAEQIDSEGFFRSKDEDSTVAASEAPASSNTSPATEVIKAAAPTTDDIPF